MFTSVIKTGTRLGLLMRVYVYYYLYLRPVNGDKPSGAGFLFKNTGSYQRLLLLPYIPPEATGLIHTSLNH